MSHYVCPGCGGESDEAKACDTEGCPLNGHTLKECNCTDGMHDEVMSQNAESPIEEEM